jgi:hypothetical protein
MRPHGLTDPYEGTKPARRYHIFGHTFRWVQGDSYIAVQQGTCIDGRRLIIINDTLADHVVREGYQPIVDAIPASDSRWYETKFFVSLVNRWARENELLEGQQDGLRSRLPTRQ